MPRKSSVTLLAILFATSAVGIYAGWRFAAIRACQKSLSNLVVRARAQADSGNQNGYLRVSEPGAAS